MKKQNLWLVVYCMIPLLTLAAAQWGSRAVTVLAENAPIKRQCRIVIDAGHGGIDGGATSCTGRPESFFNLEIALRLQDLLHFLGHETKMIRTEDISVYTKGDTIAQKKASDLKERVRIVKDTENALLLSIHQNIFPEEKYSGAQVFYADTPGSEALAVRLQEAFQKTVNPKSNRKSKPADKIYLMEHIPCTGVLIECGFLSNMREEALLRQPGYQKQLCCVIAATLSQYLTEADTHP